MTTTTNSNIFRNQVRKYVLNAIEEPHTIQSTHEEFLNWYSHHEQKQHPNIQKAFMYWLMCLPSAMSVEYRNFEMKELLEKWFTNANIPWKPKKNFDYPEYFLYLVTKEFFYLLNHPKKLEELDQ